MKAVFDSLGIERAHIAGHSFGGDVETKFALLFPDRVRSLVYLDAAHDRKGLAPGEPVPAPTRPAATADDSASAGSMRAYLARVNGTTWPEGEIRAFYRLGPDGRVVGRADRGAGFIWQEMRLTLEHPDYAHIKAPALAFYALQPKPEQAFAWYATMDADSRAKAEGNATAWYQWAVVQMEAFRKEIPDGRVVTIVGGNHFVFTSNESEVLREMRDFMRRH
jgi:pimeloyl-ACP methyl ester carboxylesterase